MFDKNDNFTSITELPLIDYLEFKCIHNLCEYIGNRIFYSIRNILVGSQVYIKDNGFNKYIGYVTIRDNHSSIKAKGKFMNKNSVCLGRFLQNLRNFQFEKLLNLTSSNSINESYSLNLSKMKKHSNFVILLKKHSNINWEIYFQISDKEDIQEIINVQITFPFCEKKLVFSIEEIVSNTSKLLILSENSLIGKEITILVKQSKRTFDEKCVLVNDFSLIFNNTKLILDTEVDYYQFIFFILLLCAIALITGK